MSLIASIPFKEIMASVDNLTALGLADMSITNDEIKRTDILMVSVTSGTNCRFWHTGKIPTPTEGHLLVLYADRFIPGKPSIKGFRIIAESGTAQLAITLFSF